MDMDEQKRMGRREFLGKAAVAAMMVPAVLGAGSGNIGAQGQASGDVGDKARAKIKKIAIEEHWANQELNELRIEWGKRTGYPTTVDPKAIGYSFPRTPDFEKFRIPFMDEFGIAMQVISTGSPGVQGFADAQSAVAKAKKINDAQAETIAKYPGRFAGFAGLPTQDPKAAADELERAVKQLGFKGAMIQGSTNWEYLDAEKYWVIWERAAALEVPIYLHVQEPSFDSAKVYAGHPELTGATWAWGVETGTHALRIINAGVFDAFPKATLILGHLGETLPYLLGRLDEGYVMAAKSGRKLQKRLSDYVRSNILVTTSGLYRPEALVCAISAMGEDRVLYAMDYPFVQPKDSIDCFESTPMSDEVREKISHLNAKRWLKL
ncbi:MAG: amidohydrolase [Deltaproteobacteria bacterium HGW-Deltaproteobacteria-15]|jgi:2,3-dihydroxybenzoate decarboxylase|nr:MAG: amidohydrolase [Deltaproteobacteria bacterium HGW-Deltaproteobacteria-15]